MKERKKKRKKKRKKERRKRGYQGKEGRKDEYDLRGDRLRVLPNLKRKDVKDGKMEDTKEDKSEGGIL